MAELDGNGAHRPSIKAEGAVSKFCRAFSWAPGLGAAAEQQRE
jgi:hypothetical protein